MRLFDSKNDIQIVLETGANEAIRLAAADMQSNLRRLSGKADGFAITQTHVSESVIQVQVTQQGMPEAYTVSVDERSVLITGSDTLGAVFGIYAFCSRCLNILPVYRLVDIFPAQRQEMYLEPQVFASEPRPVRFRGWFLNDEDLLCDFRTCGGHRNIDYPYYQNVMAPDVLDMILEAALRVEINLIIPGSFVDMDNPAEEKLVQTVVRRGMYISQHHVEPVGVSYFAADTYMKKYGQPGEEVSFISNRTRMEEIWRYYIEKWAQYGDQVIWQLGLRGKGDRAIWKSDPNVPLDDKSRGGIISDAMVAQHGIIREVLRRDDFYTTATLWTEGAALYRKGCLQVPQNTVVIFCDVGYSQMYAENFYEVPRQPGTRYGVYYHVGFWMEGPHLAEGCDLRKMVHAYQEAWKKESLYYSILNVSNVRPLHFSAWFNALLLKDPASFCPEQAFDYQLQALFGEAADRVRPLVLTYYDTIAELGREELLERYTRAGHEYHNAGEHPFPQFPATDGHLRYTGIRMLTGKFYTVDDSEYARILQESLGKWEALYEQMCAAEQTLPETCLLYFRQFLKFETFYMLQLTRWLLACRTMLQTGSEAAKNEALTALQTILDARRILEQGAWQGWHDGDKKIGIPDLMKLTEETYRKESAVKP